MKTGTPTDELPTEIDGTVRTAELIRQKLAYVRGYVMGGGKPEGVDLLLVLLAGETTISALLDGIDVLERLRRDAEKRAGRAPAPADEPDAEPAAAGARCRHEWNGAVPPACTRCGKVKSAQGRRSSRPDAAPAAVAIAGGPAKFDPESRPLPLGDVAADRFSAGGVSGPGPRR